MKHACKKGFLLIEVLITIVFFTLCVGLYAGMHWRMVFANQQALRYIRALTIACNYVEKVRMQSTPNINEWQEDGFVVQCHLEPLVVAQEKKQYGCDKVTIRVLLDNTMMVSIESAFLHCRDKV